MTTVTVYTAPSCPACTATKRHLTTRGIAFTEEPLDNTTAAAAVERGLSTAPIVCVSVDGEESYWDGFRPERIDALRGAA